MYSPSNDVYDFSTILNLNIFNSLATHFIETPKIVNVKFPFSTILLTICMIGSNFHINPFVDHILDDNNFYIQINPLEHTANAFFLTISTSQNCVITLIEKNEYSEEFTTFINKISTKQITFQNKQSHNMFEKSFHANVKNYSYHQSHYKNMNILILTIATIIFLILTLNMIIKKHKTQEYQVKYVLLTKDYELSSSFTKLLRFIEADHIHTVEEAFEYTQSKFIRKNGTERNQMPPNPFEDRFNELAPILDEINMLNSIPATGHYKYLCFNGQSTPMMRRQLEFIKRQENLTFDHIIFATGDRELSSMDDADDLYKLYEKGEILYEADAAQLLVDEYYPNDDRIVIRGVDKDPTLRRPNTRSTVVTWMDMKPEPGSILMVSNNPFIQYQYITWYNVLKENKWFENGGSLEMCGDCVKRSNVNKVAVILDNIARTLYVEKIAWKLNNP
ncbi:hypothetical protein TRFO_11505 [Tritrichomonas foetus]|uniref:Uncharacterized protein n=1 Tax=Tritrichomonas foetus TaxID=1144522 RepID=A0A1J4J310_9EUKA|nr:hypothetical protein TRFO_11505 [Tritrichomonas foetus]|eukprot:OHS93738.1 hypothetical protein TRFO_11505 [Tritrichomonas foetus]